MLKKSPRRVLGDFYGFVVGWNLTSTEHKGSSFDGLCLRWYPCLITEHDTQPQIICLDITVCVSPCQVSKNLWLEHHSKVATLI